MLQVVPRRENILLVKGDRSNGKLTRRGLGRLLSRVTLSIGDDDMKPVVTAEPEITETILYVEDEYLELWLAMALGCYEQRRDCLHNKGHSERAWDVLKEIGNRGC
ncbi:unnamed protein product [Camellia sinensis]